MGFFSKLKHGLSTVGKFIGKSALNNVKNVAHAVEASALSTVGIDLSKAERLKQERAKTAILQAQASTTFFQRGGLLSQGPPAGGLPFHPLFLLIVLYLLLRSE